MFAERAGGPRPRSVFERLDRIRAGGVTPDQRAARILELGRTITTALAGAIDVEDLYDEAGLPA